MKVNSSESPAVQGGSGAMFNQIARRYDLLNRWTSLGLDRGWRRQLVDAVDPESLPPKACVLDLATGTADVALLMLARAPHLRVKGVDPSDQMLAVGRLKWLASQRGARAPAAADALSLELGDATALTYADDAFAAATMAFGIRNVPDRARALAELRRVVVPGGPVAILELTEPSRGPVGAIARFWVHRMVPALGAWLSGASAYSYLARSIGAFPPGDQFAEEMRAAGFDHVRAHRLRFGAAHLFVGQAPAGRS